MAGRICCKPTVMEYCSFAARGNRYVLFQSQPSTLGLTPPPPIQTEYPIFYGATTLVEKISKEWYDTSSTRSMHKAWVTQLQQARSCAEHQNRLAQVFIGPIEEICKWTSICQKSNMRSSFPCTTTYRPLPSFC